MAIRVLKELNLWDGLILTCGWLPKSNNSISENDKYAWRISRGIYNYKDYPDLFIPYPNSYVKNNPRIGWSLLDELCNCMRIGEAINADIPYKEIGKLGNLSDILYQKRGKSLFYNVGIMLIRRNRQGKIIDDNIKNSHNTVKSSIKFLISIEL